MLRHEYIAGKTLKSSLMRGADSMKTRRGDARAAPGDPLSPPPPLSAADSPRQASNIMVTPEAKVALIDFDTATGDNRTPSGGTPPWWGPPALCPWSSSRAKRAQRAISMRWG